MSDEQKLEKKILRACVKAFDAEDENGSSIRKETSEGIVPFSEYPEPADQGKEGTIMGTYSKENVPHDQLISTLQGLIRDATKDNEYNYKALKTIVFGLAGIGKGANTTNIWNRLYVTALEDCGLAAVDALPIVAQLHADCADIKDHHSAKHMYAAAMVLAKSPKTRINDWAANPAEDYMDTVSNEFCGDLRDKLSSLKKKLKSASKDSESKKIKEKIKKVKEEIDSFEADDDEVAKSLYKAMQKGDTDAAVKYVYYLHHHNIFEKGRLSSDMIVEVIEKYLKKHKKETVSAKEYFNRIYKTIYEIKSWKRSSMKVEDEGKKKKSVTCSDRKAILLHLHMIFMFLEKGFERLDAIISKAESLKKYTKSTVKSMKDSLKTYSEEYSTYKKGKLMKKLYKEEIEKSQEQRALSNRQLVSIRKQVYAELGDIYEQGSEDADEVVQAKMKELKKKESEITQSLPEITQPGIPVFCIDKHTAEGGRKFGKYAEMIFKKKFSGESKKVQTRIKETLGLIHFVNIKAVLCNPSEECNELEKEWFKKSSLSDYVV